MFTDNQNKIVLSNGKFSADGKVKECQKGVKSLGLRGVLRNEMISHPFIITNWEYFVESQSKVRVTMVLVPRFHQC